MEYNGIVEAVRNIPLAFGFMAITNELLGLDISKFFTEVILKYAYTLNVSYYLLKISNITILRKYNMSKAFNVYSKSVFK
jgi:hypothetical protein